MSEQDTDVTVDTLTEVEEAPESNEEGEQEDTEALQEKLDEAEKAKSQILARAKKAEEELKALKATPIKNDPFFEERLELLASGLTREEVDKAKVIAIGNNTTLAEALKDDMFIAYQRKLKDDKRKEDAKLGASKGSGESKDDSLIKPEMSREEHQEAFKKVMGQ